ncbi:hypothetical protein ALC57_02286 [Trachymyrmex cornetzi]|uniref:Uncharacterized protein n=1 Tax=Trachymyrmex cornetzi TaxID=471704 RepID=A0A195EJ88_9HYME|nr:hypothetical protein ALC57_02286 [Trachymyrmex cornetzi]
MNDSRPQNPPFMSHSLRPTVKVTFLQPNYFVNLNYNGNKEARSPDEKLGPVNLEEQRWGARGTQRMTKLTTRPSHSRENFPTDVLPLDRCDENNEDSCLAERIYPESALARQEQITGRGGKVVLQSGVKYLFYNAAPLIAHEKLRDMSTANITKGMCSSHMGNMCPTHTRANASRVCSSRSSATAIPLKLYARRVPILNAFLE